MEAARKHGHLLFHDRKILVPQDLSAKTLEAMRRLCPLTSALTKAKVHYQWQAYTRVQIVFKGTPLTAEDFRSAARMLHHLGLEILEDLKEPEEPEGSNSWQKAGDEN